MSLLPHLQRASFNGIPFLIKKAVTKGGRKLVTHEFVRSDKRFVEDLGLSNRVFHITGIITGFNYLQQRNNLLRELELPGQGLLQHPLYGRVTVTALPFSNKEDLQKAGMAVIEMRFEEGEAQSQPLPDAFFSNALAAELAAALLALLKALLVKKYNNPTSSGNFGDSIVQNVNTGVLFASALDAVGQNADTSQYNEALENYQLNTVSFVTDPESLATSVVDLVEKSQLLFQSSIEGEAEGGGEQSTLVQSGDSAANAFAFLEQGFAFNSVGVELESDTPSNAERTNNRKAIVDMVRGMNLAAAYSQATQIQFVLADDLEATKTSLNNAFDDILNNDRMDNESIDKLEELRIAASSIFDREEVNLFKIEEIFVQTQPVGIVAFNQYGNTDNEEALLSLNQVANPSFVNGQFKILTA